MAIQKLYFDPDSLSYLINKIKNIFATKTEINTCVSELNSNIAKKGDVKTLNGEAPDANGNLQITAHSVGAAEANHTHSDYITLLIQSEEPSDTNALWIDTDDTDSTVLAAVATSGSYNDLTNKPASLPASDVYSWAKAATKPTYTASEVGAATEAYVQQAIADAIVLYDGETTEGVIV